MTQAWKSAFQEPDSSDLIERLMQKMDRHVDGRDEPNEVPAPQASRVISVIQGTKAA